MERLLDGKNITIGTCYYPEHWGRKCGRKTFFA